MDLEGRWHLHRVRRIAGAGLMDDDLRAAGAEVEANDEPCLVRFGLSAEDLRSRRDPLHNDVRSNCISGNDLRFPTQGLKINFAEHERQGCRAFSDCDGGLARWPLKTRCRYSAWEDRLDRGRLSW